MTTTKCEYCQRESWDYKTTKTKDGHWLCSECRIKMMEVAKNATLGYEEYITILDRQTEIEELKVVYLDQLRLETIKAFSSGKPTEAFIKEKVSEYVNREIEHTERLIKKGRLTITSEEYYAMIIKLLGDKPMLDTNNLSLIQAPKFLEFYNIALKRLK